MHQFFAAALIQAAAPVGASAVDPGRPQALADGLVACARRALVSGLPAGALPCK